jgi:hypothetical protein
MHTATLTIGRVDFPAHFYSTEVITLPRGAQILSAAPSAAFRNSAITLWFHAPAGETDTDEWPITLAKTGEPVPAGATFLGTVAMPGNTMERHIFLTGPKQIVPAG